MGKNTLMPAAKTIQSVSTAFGRSGGCWAAVERAARTSDAHNPCYFSRHCVRDFPTDSRLAVACKVLLQTREAAARTTDLCALRVSFPLLLLCVCCGW